MKKEKKKQGIIRKAHYFYHSYFRVKRRTKKQIDKFVDNFKKKILEKGRVPIRVQVKEVTGGKYPKYTYVVYCPAFYAGKKKAREIVKGLKENL